MTKIDFLPKNKLNTKKDAPLTEAEIYNMKRKLNDNEYIDAAIYKLASILANRIIHGGLTNEKKEI